MKKILVRLKNKKVILSVISGILMILVNVGVIDISFSDKIMDVVNSVLALGVAVGVFSNPDSHLEGNDN